MKEVSWKSYWKESFKHPFRMNRENEYEGRDGKLYMARRQGFYYLFYTTCFVGFYLAINKLQLTVYGFVLVILIMLSSTPLGYFFTSFSVLDDDGLPVDRDDSRYTPGQVIKGVVIALLTIGMVAGGIIWLFFSGDTQEYSTPFEQNTSSVAQVYEIAQDHAREKVPEAGVMDYHISISGSDKNSGITKTHFSFYFVWSYSNFLFSTHPKTVKVYVDIIENDLTLYYDPEDTYISKSWVIFEELKVDADLILDVIHRETDFDRNEIEANTRIRITPYLDEKASKYALVSADDAWSVEIDKAQGDDYRYIVTLTDGQYILLED